MGQALMKYPKWGQTVINPDSKRQRDRMRHRQMFGEGDERIENIRIAKALIKLGISTGEELFYALIDKTPDAIAKQIGEGRAPLLRFYTRVRKIIPKRVTGDHLKYIDLRIPVTLRIEVVDKSLGESALLIVPTQRASDIPEAPRARSDKKAVSKGAEANETRLSEASEPTPLSSGELFLADPSTSGRRRPRAAKAKKVAKKRRHRRPKNSASSYSLIGVHMPHIRHQGLRETCVAFASCAIAEHSEALAKGKGPRRFSEQYLYYACKLLDGVPHKYGTHLDFALEQINLHGLLDYDAWRYSKEVDPLHPNHNTPPLGTLRFVNPVEVIKLENPQDVEGIKGLIARGYAVAVSPQFFPSCFKSITAVRSGKVINPLEDDIAKAANEDAQGHSFVLVGYDKDEFGIDHFIFRNSWGKTWGRECPFGKGYGTIPFEYIRNYNPVALIAKAKTPGNQPNLIP